MKNGLVSAPFKLKMMLTLSANTRDPLRAAASHYSNIYFKNMAHRFQKKKKKSLQEEDAFQITPFGL